MNFLKTLVNRRVRGFRLVEVLAGACLVILIMSVYLSKAAAGREGAAIASINKDISDEQRRVRLLRAEVAHLEQPERLESLSARYLALAPVAPKRETVPDSLTEVARQAGAESK
jgi:hypothetical protein